MSLRSCAAPPCDDKLEECGGVGASDALGAAKIVEVLEDLNAGIPHRADRVKEGRGAFLVWDRCL